jgi:serine/threonine-protein kinase TTK/MPS1
VGGVIRRIFLRADQLQKFIATDIASFVMATASPTPLGSSNFGQPNRRAPSRQTFRQLPARPHLARSGPLIPLSSEDSAAHARQLSLNDSSDDEIPMPMKFSALTKALLSDEASILPPSSPVVNPNNLSGSTAVNEGARHARIASDGFMEEQAYERAGHPETRINSPLYRRIVRLSGTPKSSVLRRTSLLSSAAQKCNEPAIMTETKVESPIDLNTPSRIVRTVRIPITASGDHRLSVGSSGKLSSRTNSSSRVEEGDFGALEDPATASRAQVGVNHGSVSRYGTVGRNRYGDETGMQSSMRPKRLGKVAGTFLSGPARRGRRRQSEDEQEPCQENEDGQGVAYSSQEPESQDPQIPEPLSSREYLEGPSYYVPKHRDFASGSPISASDLAKPQPHSSPEGLSRNSPPQLAEAEKKLSPHRAQPLFRIPAPRPDLPSAHDQENEAPPTFKRNKPISFVYLDKMEKVAIRTQDEIGSMRGTSSPQRQPLAAKSQNTPHRVAPPPPKMSKLETATATGGAAATSHGSKKCRNNIRINGKTYTRMDIIGRGGSSKVWRVMAENYKVFALKRVSLEDADENAIRGYKGEIDLLKKLEGNDRVVDILDYEMNDEKQTLSVVSILPY